MTQPDNEPGKPDDPTARILIGLSIATVIGLLIWGWATGRLDDYTSGDTGESSGGDECVDVIYEYEGSAPSVSVTYQTSTGGTQQFTDVEVPGKSAPGCFESGGFAYVSAQNEADFGSITCRIVIEGTVVEESTSAGGYVIATCSGTI